MLRMRAGSATAEVDPQGGMLRRLRVGDTDLLRTPADDAAHHGCFVMAPWAGRTAFGAFTFEGVSHHLPINMAPHAIHGTVRDRTWVVERADPLRVELSCDLGPRWPFRGWAQQRLTLFADHLDWEVSVHSGGEEFPASLGWHPWFRRHLHPGGPPGNAPAPSQRILRRDADHLATREVVPVGPGPWDDCFVDLDAPLEVLWGDAAVRIEHDCPVAIVFDELADTFCIEPQTAPPDALNRGDASVVGPNRPLRARCSWHWTLPTPADLPN